jgi:hypothetical protein
MKTFESIIKNTDKEVIEKTLIRIYNVGAIVVIETDNLLEPEVTFSEPANDDSPKLFISDMSKDQFRKAIYQAVGARPTDMPQVNKALKKVIRLMRKTLGGLNYTQEYVKIAATYYQK